MSTFEIEVFSDVVCPWCFLAAERLDKVIASLERPDDVTVIYRTFLLDPATPAKGERIADRLRSKYGIELRAAQERIEAAARESGFALDLTKQEWTYPTEGAHTLLRHARAKGTQKALARAFFEAYFVEAKNISDIAVLTNVATAHGFDADEIARLLDDPAELSLTREDAQAASEGGIGGVPFFVFGGKVAVSGAQRESVLLEAIQKARGVASGTQ